MQGLIGVRIPGPHRPLSASLETANARVAQGVAAGGRNGARSRKASIWRRRDSALRELSRLEPLDGLAANSKLSWFASSSGNQFAICGNTVCHIRASRSGHGIIWAWRAGREQGVQLAPNASVSRDEAGRRLPHRAFAFAEKAELARVDYRSKGVLDSTMWRASGATMTSSSLNHADSPGGKSQEHPPVHRRFVAVPVTTFATSTSSPRSSPLSAPRRRRRSVIPPSSDNPRISCARHWWPWSRRFGVGWPRRA